MRSFGASCKSVSILCFASSTREGYSSVASIESEISSATIISALFALTSTFPLGTTGSASAKISKNPINKKSQLRVLILHRFAFTRSFCITSSLK